MPNIVIVEDDQPTRDLISRYLRDHSFEVEAMADGRRLSRYLVEKRVDLIVLDLMLPGQDGLTLCRSVKANANTPVIILTAKSDDVDRILGLEMGADDYLAKPFNPRELLARINAVLRRQPSLAGASARPGGSKSSFDGWRIDHRLRELRDPTGALVPLTSSEFDLLQAFCDRHGRVLSREALYGATQSRFGRGRSLDVMVSRLRGKLDRCEGSSMIKTVRAGGYLFMPAVEKEP